MFCGYLFGGDLRKTFDDLCDLIAEASADILYGVLGILDASCRSAQQIEVDPRPISLHTIRATAMGWRM